MKNKIKESTPHLPYGVAHRGGLVNIPYGPPLWPIGDNLIC